MRKVTLVALGASLLLASSLSASVIAKIDGKDVTSEQIDKSMSMLLQGHSVKTLPKGEQKKIVEMYAVQSALITKAKKMNLENTKAYKDVMYFARQNALVNAYQRSIFDTIKVSSKEARDYYNDNKSKFVLKDRVEARHILVKTKAEAMNIIKQLQGLKGEALTRKFAQLAKDKSIDRGSAARGGELGYFEKKSMVPAFANAAFALKNGQYTKTPVQSKFGYHIILREGFAKAETLSFDKVEGKIKEGLKVEKFNIKMARKAASIVKDANIVMK